MKIMWIKSAWMSVIAGLGWLFGGSLAFLPILLILIVIDTIFGVLNARINGDGITSEGFRKVARKCTFYFGSLVAVNLAVTSLGIIPAATMITVYALIGAELLSILEHWRLSGMMPTKVEKLVKTITGAIKSHQPKPEVDKTCPDKVEPKDN